MTSFDASFVHFVFEVKHESLLNTHHTCPLVLEWTLQVISCARHEQDRDSGERLNRSRGYQILIFIASMDPIHFLRLALCAPLSALYRHSNHPQHHLVSHAMVISS